MCLKLIQKEQFKKQQKQLMIGNKIANKIKRVPQNLRQNNSETVTNEHGEQIPNERYVSLREKKNIIDDLRLIMNITMIM